MKGYVLRRVLGLVPTLLVIVVASFLVIRLAPGSPFSSERSVPPEVLADLERAYGFDQPMYVQLLSYVGNLLRGDLGLSTKYPQRTVNEIIADGFPATLALGALALAWALLLGVSAGIVGAIRQNTRFDHAAMGLAMIGISLPTFVLGPLLILLFALTFYVLPPGGWGGLRHVILPGITLGTAFQAISALPAMTELPLGVSQANYGEAEYMSEMFRNFALALLAGILMVAAVLVLLFKDFLQPITILVALPLSIGGAALALLLFGASLDLSSTIGIHSPP